MKKEGVPVDASVAAIFPAMWPDFPMPVTMTRPWQFRQIWQARANAASSRGLSAAIARSSISSARRPAAINDSGEAEPLLTSAFMAESYRLDPAQSLKLSTMTPPAMTPETIAELIRAGLPGATVHVESDDNVHFGSRIVAPQFAGLRPIARHQLVYKALGALMGREIHALSIEALTPDEAGT
jgi:acid stress-induced BolA-like protein IbaG/YrbA